MATAAASRGHTSHVRARRLRFMTWFVRAAGVYNASAVVVFLTPGALELVGVREPHSPF